MIDQTQELMKRPEHARFGKRRKNTVARALPDEIPKNLHRPNLDREDCGNAIIYTHTDKTRGIVYVDLNFKMILSDPEQISLAELLTKVIGVYATECYGELALSNMIGTYLGDTDVIFIRIRV
jgi:Zn-dependent M16 (insulinase) family peptidase